MPIDFVAYARSISRMTLPETGGYASEVDERNALAKT